MCLLSCHVVSSAAVDHGGYDDEYSDDDDDEGYQEALAASLHDNKDVAFPALGAARPGAGRGAGAWGVGMGVAAAPSSDAAAAGGGGNTAGTGLVNRQGECLGSGLSRVLPRRWRAAGLHPSRNRLVLWCQERVRCPPLTRLVKSSA